MGADKLTEEDAEKKSVRIDELMGMAMGVVGLSFGDFCRLTYGELEAILKAYREQKEMYRRDKWERMRLHAVMTMQPHCHRKLHPRKVLPFEWEKPRTPGRVNRAPELSKAEAKEAFLRRIQMEKE